MIDLSALNEWRTRPFKPELGGWLGDESHGQFHVTCPTTGRGLVAVASSGYGWDHVSVSVQGRMTPPAWPEMEFIRRLFFAPDEAVMQYHAPISDYVTGENGTGHPGCLHLWRPYDVRAGVIPVPPKWMVGGMSYAEADAAAEASERAGLGPKR